MSAPSRTGQTHHAQDHSYRQRLFLGSPTPHYGSIDALVRSRVNIKLINDSWDDLLRVIGSLLVGAVKASALFRYFAGGRCAAGSTPSSTDKNPATPWPAKFCTAKGELRQKYKEGHEDQPGALEFMTNVCILWNTAYTARALEEMRAEGKRFTPPTSPGSHLWASSISTCSAATVSPCPSWSATGN